MNRRGPEVRQSLRIIDRILTLSILLLPACSHTPTSVAGGGTRGGNPVVTGSIVRSDGSAARTTRITLVAADYNPVTDNPQESLHTTTTDSLGRYELEVPDSGRFNLEAVSDSDGSRLIKFAITALRDSTLALGIDTLHHPGMLSVAVPHYTGTSEGYIYVPGTTIGASVSDTTDTLQLDSVPVGTLPELRFAGSDASNTVIRYTFDIHSDESTNLLNPRWNRALSIILNTTPAGADVAGTVTHFPVLIRLNHDNFDFTQAQGNGHDLLFSSRHNERLACDIEMWDSVSSQANIWVLADTVFGNNSTQSITMYWGNADAEMTSNSNHVFDTASGYQAVWHMGDATPDSVHDATVNKFDGISPDSATPHITAGIIGDCRTFNGADDFITIPGTAKSSLSFQQNGNYSVSAWVRIETFSGLPQVVVSKGYEQYFLRATYFPSDFPLWEFTEFNDDTKWQSTRTPADTGVWMLITGVRQGTNQQLYCNGELADSSKDLWFNTVARDTSNEVSIGAFLQSVTVPTNDGRCFLKGSIDEVRISSVARSPDWVRLCFMNQRNNDRLTEFR